MRVLSSVTAALVALVLLPETSPQHQSFLGRWNLTGTGTDVDHVYWLEIKENPNKEEAGGQLSGLFLNRTSSPVQLASVKVESGELIFQLRARGDRPAPEFRAKVEGDKLIGHHTERDRTVNWVGVRPPKWPSASSSGQHRYGAPVVLFDGASAASLDAFRPQNANRPLNWAVEEGVMTNAPPANNLVSKQTFQNFRLQAEYKVSQGSNGGIYLRGRYELQVLDDHGKPVEKTGNMAVYGWTPPLVNASRPAGEWQSLDATIVGNRLTATLNGEKVHDNTEIQAITGGALDANESAPGPLLIQGDHSKIWFRKITVTPIN
jgi:hypothetical protein